MSRTVRLTTAQGIVKWLIAQRTTIDAREAPLFPGVYAIFGHGNVTCLGHALEQAGDVLPTWRGQNEQGMALAAIGYAKATRARQIMVATTSIGPGALNMVTAAGVAMANRLPLLMFSGDTFLSRAPDPVLQQIEHPGAPATTANDAFRSVTRFWDRVTSPDQLLSSLPGALAILLNPSERGPAFFALPQDVQATAWDFPERFFDPVVHVASRPRPDREEVRWAAHLLKGAQRPLIVAGGGVHYSLAESALAAFAKVHQVPVVETMAGRSTLLGSDPLLAGPLGVTGWEIANELAGAADVVLAVGTRLGDFTTGSWSLFDRGATIIGLNASNFDARKHRSAPLVGDAQAALADLESELVDWVAEAGWARRALEGADDQRRRIVSLTACVESVPTYAQVVATVNQVASDEDYVVTASGGLPGELNANWLSKAIATFDCEYGFSCMGYEISGGWGAAMARPSDQVYVLVGDGSYMMLNSDLYSSVLTGHPMVVVVCDNGGYAVIDRLQVNQGGASFNNMLKDCRGPGEIRVDFAAHARAMGCDVESVASVEELNGALVRSRGATRTRVIVIETDPAAWSPEGAFWEVGVPEVSDREPVDDARQKMQREIAQRNERRPV